VRIDAAGELLQDNSEMTAGVLGVLKKDGALKFRAHR